MTAPVLADRLRTARARRGLGLRELARAIELSPSYLSNIEAGHRTPSEGVLQSLCTCLHLDFDEMVALSGRLDEATERYLARQPLAITLLRKVARAELSEAQVQALIAETERMIEGTA